MLAARADLPLDHLDDTVLVADLDRRPGAGHVLEGARINMALGVGDRSLSLRIEPAPGQRHGTDGGHRMGAVGSIIERLADDISVQPDGATLESFTSRRPRRATAVTG